MLYCTLYCKFLPFIKKTIMTKLIKNENINDKTKQNVAYGLELMYLDKLFNAKVLDEPQYRTMKKYLIKKYKIEK